jgi:ribosomal protein L29
LEAYKKRKLNLKRKDMQISEMSKDINNLKEDLFEIKSVLQTIVQKI